MDYDTFVQQDVMRGTVERNKRTSAIKTFFCYIEKSLAYHEKVGS
jgi:hypothetical protein